MRQKEIEAASQILSRISLLLRNPHPELEVWRKSFLSRASQLAALASGATVEDIDEVYKSIEPPRDTSEKSLDFSLGDVWVDSLREIGRII